jgi:Fe-S cluster assembly protein SufD
MENTEIKKDFKSYIKKEFEKIQSSLNGSSGSEINLTKQKSFDSFFLKGLPTLKSENWKYTNLTFLNKIDFELQNYSINSSLIDSNTFYYNLENSTKIYLINGNLISEKSNLLNNDDLKIEYFQNISKNGTGKYSNYYGKLVQDAEHPFAQINSALAENLLVINIADKAVIENPIQIINITDSTNSTVFVNTRILVISGKFSSAKIVENGYTFGENQGVRNVVKEMYLDDNSHLNYYKIQDDSPNSYTFDYTQVKQERDSHFDEAAISINGKFVRNDLRAELNNENIETHFYGIFIAGNNDFVDNHTFADHSKPHCFSNENYRGIISGKATGVFNGKILVRRDAQKTNAYQSNKNVLLSDTATINTKPELEIYADDVKCSHGATSGALDKTSLFYLRARGIDPAKAERMLLSAFTTEVVREIKIDTLSELITNRIELKLSQI